MSQSPGIMWSLENRVALVTGGATGIGREVAIALGRHGAAAVAVAYASSEDEAIHTVAQIESLGCLASAFRADVADGRQARALVQHVVRRFGRLDVLVNSAGTTTIVPFDDLGGLTDEVWRRVMDVNVLGAYHCVHAAAPHLTATSGAIVNVGSISATRAVGSSIAYGASKAALQSMTRGLALALAPHVRVNAVEPGTVNTRWFHKRVGNEVASASLKAEAAYVPLRRLADPQHVAQAVLGLLGSELVTGETLIVDAGKHILY